MEDKQVNVEKCARHVILDIGVPMTSRALHYTINSLEKVLSLASVLKGPPRIPLFALTLINGHMIPVIRLGEVKGQFNKIRNSFTNVYSLSGVTEKPSVEDYNDYLYLCLKSALDEFKPFELCTNGTWAVSKIEVTFVTLKMGIVVQETLKRIVNCLNFSRLKRIQVIQLLERASEELVKDQLRAIVQLIGVTIGSTELEDVFRSWLTAREVDREQMTLLVGDRRSSTLRFLCDLTEAALDPNLLPFAQRFNLGGFCYGPPAARSTIMRNPENELTHYELEVVGRLASSGLSESYVFGVPVIVTPHAGSTELNRQTFSALCSSLIESEEYLLARLVATEPPHGYFVLMPGCCCFLAKCMATSELALTKEEGVMDGGSMENPTSGGIALAAITSFLATVPRHDVYNPKQFESGILPHVFKLNSSPKVSTVVPLMTGHYRDVSKRRSEPCVMPSCVKSIQSATRALQGSRKRNTNGGAESAGGSQAYNADPSVGRPKVKKFKEQQDMLKYFRHDS